MIKAVCIASTRNSKTSTVLKTFVLEYPRFIHSEFMTHRVFSRNAASSRAIPVEKVIEQVKNRPAMPIHWGANQKGMKAKSEVKHVWAAKLLWKLAAKAAAFTAKQMIRVGLHKQVANRILEPFQTIKVIMSTTDLTNFMELRDHPDAQPEIQELAKAIQFAFIMAPDSAEEEWHVPFLEKGENGRWYYGDYSYDLENALIMSAAMCAAVSYRTEDMTLAKARKIVDSLANSRPMHASPFEHQATVYNGPKCCNFDGFKQQRQFMEEAL